MEEGKGGDGEKEVKMQGKGRELSLLGTDRRGESDDLALYAGSGMCIYFREAAASAQSETDAR